MGFKTPCYHLVPVDGSWGVRQDGGRNYECIYQDRLAALRAAQRIAHEKRGVLVVHDQRGRAGPLFDYRM